MESPIQRLLDLQRRIRLAVAGSMLQSSPEDLSRTVRDDQGDTIFGIDLSAEEVLLPFCEEWGTSTSFILLAEGIEPEGLRFGSSTPEFRLIVDPIDGTRGLMHDKRSAWSLAAIAKNRGTETRLEHVYAAAMTELPTSRHATFDALAAHRGEPTRCVRSNLFTGEQDMLHVAPSTNDSLRHGFASVSDFFPGGKAILGQIADAIFQADLGGWNPEKAEIFSDQYICSGGQLAELILGRDRFVLDIRPLVYAKLGVTSSLCCRPYDLCTVSIAQQAGVIVTAPDGSPLNPLLDVTTNVSFVAYANRSLADRLQPIVNKALADAELL